MDITWVQRNHAVVLTLAAALPLAWCALAEQLADNLTSTTAALVLVVLVVAAAATGDRLAGAIAALSAAAWFDFFLTQPVRSFTIDGSGDVEVAILLVIVGVAVTEITLWGRRQQASSSIRAGYLEGVITTSQIVAGQLSTTDLVDHVATSITELLEIDSCRFVEGSNASPNRPSLEPDGTVTVRGKRTNVERDGLPTMNEILLPARYHGATFGHFVMTASTHSVRPTLEQRQVAVLLANQVGAELASGSTRHP
ncbi:MAG: Osmosensitive channel histidine kinaselike protein [Nocardioidaceae bacterium]|nr:Osmosensitive channel histidine kinaselike protein [Nocardioidaceae bacterium]